MMWWGTGNWSWGAWAVMTLTMLVFWGLLIWAVVALVRRPGDSAAGRSRPEDLLDERFARGEIDEDEYRRRRETLRARR